MLAGGHNRQRQSHRAQETQTGIDQKRFGRVMPRQDHLPARLHKDQHAEYIQTIGEHPRQERRNRCPQRSYVSPTSYPPRQVRLSYVHLTSDNPVCAPL
jgi:hypothetical protein